MAPANCGPCRSQARSRTGRARPRSLRRLVDSSAGCERPHDYHAGCFDEWSSVADISTRYTAAPPFLTSPRAGPESCPRERGSGSCRHAQRPELGWARCSTPAQRPDRRGHGRQRPGRDKNEYLLFPQIKAPNWQKGQDPTKSTAPTRIAKEDRFKPMASTTLHRWWYRCLERAGVVEKDVTAGMKMHSARYTAGRSFISAQGTSTPSRSFSGMRTLPPRRLSTSRATKPA